MESAPRSDPRSWRHKPGVAWLYVFIVALTVALVIPAASGREEMIRLGCYVVESRGPSPNVTSWMASDLTVGRHATQLDSYFQTSKRDVVTRTGFNDIDIDACKRNVKVQKLLAHINMVSATSNGILGAMSTAAWSSLSDRVGRTRILAMAVVGIAINQLLFLSVLVFPQAMVYTGGSVLFVGPIIDGLLGGNELLTSVYVAYLADVTSVDNITINSAGFTTASAVAAMVTPMVGPFLVAWSGDRLLPFKVGASLVVLIAAFVAFVVPESLSLEARDRLVKMAATEQTQEAGPTASGASTSYRRRFGRLVQRVWSRALKHILAPLDALSVFKPRPFPDGRPGRDWNLFNIAVINFLITLSREESPEVQYVIFAFGWGQVELGRRMSLLATWRTVIVLSIIPLYRFVLKPLLAERMSRRLDSSNEPNEQTPLVTPPGDEPESADGATVAETRAKTRIDLGFLGTSLAVEMLGYVAMGTNAAGSVWQYAVGKAVSMAGIPGSMVIEPLLLELGPKGQATGRLFGANAVLTALGGTFCNSILFNSVLSATIGSYAPAMFLVAASLYLFALLCVTLIRVPRP